MSPTRVLCRTNRAIRRCRFSTGTPVHAGFSTGLLLGIISTIPLEWGPDEPSIHHASVAMTMAFCGMGISTLLSGFVMRHDKLPAFTQPLLRFAAILAAGGLIVILSTQFQFLQRWLLTTSLTAPQWGAVLGLALVMPLVVEADKFVQRLRARNKNAMR